MRGLRRAAGVAACLLAATPAFGQSGRPRAEVTPIVVSRELRAGATAELRLAVKLPAGIHVQANQPRDPSLIPTVLTVTAPAGATVEAITYPEPDELRQKNRGEPLVVLGPEFFITVRVRLAAGMASSELVIPGVLRYQACDDALCYPPARATTEWLLPVEARPTP
ncbi:MAG: protein-disulfide reductase DsbD domain-containing protein [Acidobacteriota bacterium]